MEYFVVDAFTDKPFKGNPAGVVIMEKFLPDNQLQNIASELNLSETAFVIKISARNYFIRWFTPLEEAPLCGHATIGSLKILHDLGEIKEGDKVYIESVYHKLTAHIEKDNWYSLTFPKFARRATSVEECEQISSLLNFAPQEVWHSENCYTAVLEEGEQVEQAEVNLQHLIHIDCRALIITARSSEQRKGYDFIARYFAPRVGIPEDPTCGSSFSRLTPYWAEKLGKNQMLAYYASRRGGVVKTVNLEDAVIIAGEAKVICKGKIYHCNEDKEENRCQY